MTLPENVIRYGHPESLPQRVRLWAGPLSLIYLAGDIRYIALGDREILRRVYVGVRDPNWDTVPAVLSNVCILRREDSFDITYDARHRQGDIDFAWHGRITGESDASIVFTMEGEALSTFRRNRIGFCTLHPMADCAGADCRIEHADGSTESGIIPRAISPHQPFRDIRAISHRVADDLWARVEMNGDTFEMEDQRNWTDASFKTYSTPLDLPFPVTVRAGTRIAQSVRLELCGRFPAMPLARPRRAPTITLGQPLGPLPRIGLGVATHGEPLTEQEQSRLRDLNLSHLWAEIDLTKGEPRRALGRAWEQAAALGIALEIALVVSDEAERQIESLLDVLWDVRPRVTTWYVHHRDTPTTTVELAQTARSLLRRHDPQARVGGGTRTHFAELNRNRPVSSRLDAVCYAITPQVHAFDNASLIETLPTQAVTVENARRFAGGRPIAIHSVTLKPRLNPVATGPERVTPPNEMPARVDPRQMSLFGAAWTLGSLKYLAQASLEVVTYYETTGWLGVMEREAGSVRPDLFPSLPASLFPVYHLLRAVGECAEWQVLRTTSSQPLAVEALALSSGLRVRTLVANLTARPLVVSIPGLARARVTLRLDASNAEHAMTSPQSLVPQCEEASLDGNHILHVDLDPWGLVILDGAASIVPGGC